MERAGLLLCDLGADARSVNTAVHLISRRLSPATGDRSMWPTTQVMNSGVAPCFCARSTAAPLSSSSRAASTWPSLQAQYSGATAAAQEADRRPRLFPAASAPRRCGQNDRR